MSEEKALTPFQELKMEATTYSKSSLLPQALRNKPEDVFIILQQARELGIGPMQGLSGITVIQGKPSVSPELHLGLIKSRHPDAYVRIEADPVKLSVTVEMAPSRDRRDEGFTTTWNMERAKAMGLAGKDNYVKQPLVMLRWRAIGEAARVVFPHVTKGALNEFEAEDLAGPSAQAPKLKEIFQAKATVVTGEAEPVSLPEVEPSGLELEA